MCGFYLSCLQKQCNVEEVAIFPAGSESFSQKNLNCSVEEGLKRFKLVADQAVKDGLRVRGYVSCVVGCPYDGPIHPKGIAKVIKGSLTNLDNNNARNTLVHLLQQAFVT